MTAKAKKQQEAVLPAADEAEKQEAMQPEIIETEPETPEAGQDPAQEEPGKVQVLVAQTHILHLSHQYKPGDILPANYPDMVEAWIEAGTAAWVDEEELKPKPKASLAAAISGLVGRAVSSESDGEADLVGRVPQTEARKK